LKFGEWVILMRVKKLCGEKMKNPKWKADGIVNKACFKIQIIYWKLLFKYKYHNSYQEAVIPETNKTNKRYSKKGLKNANKKV